MSETKRGPGRPRMPDTGVIPVSIRTEMLPEELRAQKRLYDRLRQRKLRETRRRNRANPQGLPVGVDGLAAIHNQTQSMQPERDNGVGAAQAPVADTHQDELPAERMLREIRRAQGLI